MKTFFRTISYLKSYWYLQFLALFCALVMTFLGLVNPWISKLLIDDVIGNRNVGLLGLICLMFLGASVLGLLFRTLQSYLFTKVGEQAGTDLQYQIFGHLQRLSLLHFENDRTGNLMAHFTSDVPVMQKLYTSTFIDFVTNSLALIVTFVVMMEIDWRLTLMVLPTVPCSIAANAVFRKPIRDTATKVQEQNAQISENLQEKILGIREIQAFTQEQGELSWWGGLLMKKVFLKIKENLLGSASSGISNLVAAMGGLWVLWYGGQKVIAGDMQLGVLIAYTSYLYRLFGPGKSLLEFTVEIQKVMAAADRVFQFLDRIPSIRDRKDAKPLLTVMGNVRFDHVHFSYQAGVEVLTDIDFAVRPGEKIALVGSSGAGKSTMAYLIPRFYDPTKGRILLDGIDLRDIQLDSLRQHVGMVFQDAFLFSATVRENIRFGNNGANEEQIIAAAKDANAHDFIMELPQGYSTEVGERGVKFSGGQKQRIAIARTILRDPRILILDEATSSLDSESEAAIQEALERLMLSRTSFVIAHRLSTVLRVDRIFVLEASRIVECGTHDELVHHGGTYASLFETQAQYYR